MAMVVADMSVSLDGFVADSSERGRPSVRLVQQTAARSTAPGDPGTGGPGVIISGRRTFEVADGWGGHHPTGAPVIVVTHQVPSGWPREDSTVSFETGGIETAMQRAQEIAGDQVIALATPSIIRQCLDLGLVDRIQVKLVPLLLGDGTRLFNHLNRAPIELDDPEVTEGNGVTHLHYNVQKQAS